MVEVSTDMSYNESMKNTLKSVGATLNDMVQINLCMKDLSDSSSHYPYNGQAIIMAIMLG